MAAARSRVLLPAALVLFAISAAPRAFLGPPRAPPAPAPGTPTVSASAAGQARNQGPNFVASTAAAVLLVAVAAAGRGVATVNRSAWGKAKQEGIVDQEKKQRWFPFGRRKEKPDEVKQLLEETQDLAARVAVLDNMTADMAQMEAQEEEPTVDTAESAMEPAAEVLAEDAIEEAAVAEEPAAEAFEEMELPLAEQPMAAKTECVQEVPIAEEPVVVAGAETRSADKPQASAEPVMEVNQAAALDLLDEEHEVLEKVLKMAQDLENDNQHLKEELKVAQKMCFELLDEKMLGEESAPTK